MTETLNRVHLFILYCHIYTHISISIQKNAYLYIRQSPQRYWDERAKQILAVSSFLMITILCLDPSRGACAFVWISKEIKQQKDTDNSMCVSCGAFFLKILNDLTKCNEGRVKTNVMPGTVPRCCSPIWAGDLLRSPVAKAGTELRSLDLISPQRQGSLRQPPTHSRFPFTHAGCCSQECCIKLLPRFTLCKQTAMPSLLDLLG